MQDISITRIRPVPSQLSRWQLLICSPFLNFIISYKWSHTICGLSGRLSLSAPSTGGRLVNTPFPSLLLPLCSVDVPPAERHLSCFQAVATANKIAIDIRVQDFV